MVILLLLAWMSGWETSGIAKQRNLNWYFADDGISQPIHPKISNPAGLHYNNITYIVWQTIDPYIIEYGHGINNWSDAVQVGINPLVNDEHGPPSILRDTLGYLHVFYGCHATLMQHAKSTNPNDITAWTDMGNIGAGQMTYAKAMLASNGNLYVFFRCCGTAISGEHAHIRSTDNGNTWGGVVQLISFGVGKSTGYGAIEYEIDSNRVHYAWCYYDNASGKRLNIYHVYLDLSDNNMYSMDGTNMGGQVSEAEANANCLVYNSVANKTNQPVVHVYAGIPYIIFQHDDTGWKHKFTEWNGVGWDVPALIVATDNQFNSCDFIVHSASNIEAHLVTSGQAGRGGDIERWDWNGAAWAKERTILAEGGKWNVLGNPQIVENYNDGLKLIFAEQIVDNYGIPLKVFGYGNRGFVKKEY